MLHHLHTKKNKTDFWDDLLIREPKKKQNVEVLCCFRQPEGVFFMERVQRSVPEEW